MKTHKVDINTASPNTPNSSVMIIYTGGTLGMVKNKKGSYVPFNFENILKRIPELNQLECLLTVLSFDEPIDSSNMNPKIWIDLAKTIEQNYDDYDGFVVIHGTDTMAYTASAISFLMENLSKPIIFTGAQLPIGELRTDARENLINALEVAKAKNSMGFSIVPEVCIFFDDLLLRANRSKKDESSHFDAFKSENYPRLAEAGVSIEYNNSYILTQTGHELVVRDSLNENIALLKLYPGITQEVCEMYLKLEHLEGLILETFGAGNVPTHTWFQNFLKALTVKGVIIFNVSQCDEGRVIQGKYETSGFLNEIGVVSGSDITTEAAIPKMMYLLANTSKELAKHHLALPLRGEMDEVIIE